MRDKLKSIIFSMRGKILGVVVLVSFIATFAGFEVAGSYMQKTMEQQVQNNMHDLVVAYNAVLERELGLDGELSYDTYASVLQGVKLDIASESSYAYLVDGLTGTMLYHPTRDKVGEPVENSVVKGLVQDINSGKSISSNIVSYEYKGAIKYAAYIVQSDDSILVITADEDEILSFEHTLRMMTGAVMIVCLVVFSIVGWIFGSLFAKPLGAMKNMIERTSNFDFKKSGDIDKIAARRDEIGDVAKSVQKMQASMSDIVLSLMDDNKAILNKVKSVLSIGDEINDSCTDTSSTTEELAAGMEETSATTETINSSIGMMQSEAKNIEDVTVEKGHKAEDIIKKAESLYEATAKSKEESVRTYTDVKESTDKAIEESKVVNKIGELTETISGISSQTSLLALNANIEAARAGEAGRGFAVVATEIGNLAKQTTDAVDEINAIVADVLRVTNNMVGTLQTSLSFMQDVVLKDYESFESVSLNYRDDAKEFQESMREIEHNIKVLTESIGSVAVGVDGINSTVNEATLGVADIAEKASGIVEKTMQNRNLASECVDDVRNMEELIGRFSIDKA